MGRDMAYNISTPPTQLFKKIKISFDIFNPFQFIFRKVVVFAFWHSKNKSKCRYYVQNSAKTHTTPMSTNRKIYCPEKGENFSSKDK